MNIKISTISKEKIQKLGILDWPIWSCEISEFDWKYDDRETCYLLEGAVEVVSEHETVKFSAGDYVIFPKGLECRWRVTSPVRKHYLFG